MAPGTGRAAPEPVAPAARQVADQGPGRQPGRRPGSASGGRDAPSRGSGAGSVDASGHRLLTVRRAGLLRRGIGGVRRRWTESGGASGAAAGSGCWATGGGSVTGGGSLGGGVGSAAAGSSVGSGAVASGTPGSGCAATGGGSVAGGGSLGAGVGTVGSSVGSGCAATGAGRWRAAGRSARGRDGGVVGRVGLGGGCRGGGEEGGRRRSVVGPADQRPRGQRTRLSAGVSNPRGTVSGSGGNQAIGSHSTGQTTGRRRCAATGAGPPTTMADAGDRRTRELRARESRAWASARRRDATGAAVQGAAVQSQDPRPRGQDRARWSRGAGSVRRGRSSMRSRRGCRRSMLLRCRLRRGRGDS